MTATITSYDDLEVGSGNVVNEVEYQYDDFGQMIEDIQSHSGAVTGTTPKVAYQYADGSSENTIRRTSMTYPDGRKVLWQYGAASSIDQTLSRIKNLKVEGETSDLLTYTHVGAARYVAIAYPEPSLELSYIKAATDPMRDSGDPYTGYDRFGRTVDMKWQNDDGSEMKDRIQYGYNQSGNRTWRKNLVAPENQDEHYGYDELYQVTDFARGNINLNQTAIGGTPTYEQNFAYDLSGNWDRYTTSEDGTEILDQTRSHNEDNQITQINGSNGGILYDRAGNALKMPPNKDGDWSKYYQLTWDAWNRLVTIKDDSGALVGTYQYDGRTRRTIKLVDGTTTHFYYNDLWKCVEERIDASTTAHQQYLWGARPNHRDELIRRDRDIGGTGSLDETLFCLMDYYDPTSITDQSGNVVERYQFSAFGVRQITDVNWAERATSIFDVTFALHGEFRDAESGFDNYGFRYYSPQIGRWPSRDPIGEEGGFNQFSFIGNNALAKSDYLGLAEIVRQNQVFHIDADGSPRAFHPDSIRGDDRVGNAGLPDEAILTVGASYEKKPYGVYSIKQTDGTWMPPVKGPGDPDAGFFISTTALVTPGFANSDQRRYVNSRVVPYVVYDDADKADGVRLGDLATVVNTETGDVRHAIVADYKGTSPGEGSMYLAILFGIDHRPRNGGDDNNDYCFIFYTQSNSNPRWPRANGSILREGNRLYQDWEKANPSHPCACVGDRPGN